MENYMHMLNIWKISKEINSIKSRLSKLEETDKYEVDEIKEFLMDHLEKLKGIGMKGGN